MNDVYFKASLQNTLNPEVGTFDNVKNKEGTFTLEDGEYYLTNTTSSSYGVYRPTKTINSVGFTIEFDVNYDGSSRFGWCLVFNGDDSTYWFGVGTDGENLEFRGQTLPNYHLIASPNTWLHVKCIFDYDHNQNYVDIYIDNVKVNTFTISNNYGIKYIDILGNSGGFVPTAKIKNIIIYNSSKKHYLDTNGLTSVWSKIKSLFATKSELASKANDNDVAHKSGDETIAGTKTFSSNIVGNVTGNASTATTATTATKLATARTIALSGAVTGTATAFDGSGNITIPVTALAASSIRVQWYAAYPNGPEAHNAMWGGRDISDAFNNGTVSRRIADGTFRDIFPGDYITKQVTIPKVLADDGTTELFAGGTLTVNWVIADCDYWINKGETAMTAHHVAIVPQQPIFNARMNSTNTTEGGYKGSEMYRNIIPACATGIVSAFGSEHILTFRDLIVNNINASGISLSNSALVGVSALGSGQWVYAQCNLIGEHMVYGHSVWSSGGENQMIQTRQMSAFRLSEKLINYNRQWWWLRDVVSSAAFALVYGYGLADTSAASGVTGVRPFALLR